MNILFYRYNSICEPDILTAFKYLGHNVVEESTEIYNKNITGKECISLVSSILLDSHFDCVFSINFYPVLSEVCNIFKIRYICWIVDSPILELYSHSIRNEWNRIFLFDQALYNEFYQENPNGIFHFPLATNIERSDLVCSQISEKDKNKFSSDISFIGSLYSEKCPYNNAKNMPDYLTGYLNGIIEAQLKVYGYNFVEELLTDDIVTEFKQHIDFYQFPELSNHNDKAVMANYYLNVKVAEQERLRILGLLSKQFKVNLYTKSDTSSLPYIQNKGFANPHTDMPKIFRLSKINLNITAKSIHSALPLRIWDVLGSKGFLITNYQSEIPDHFQIGSELEIYSSESELIEKVKYYLAHEDERRLIAQNGYNKVKQLYTYQIRVNELLAIAFNA